MLVLFYLVFYRLVRRGMYRCHKEEEIYQQGVCKRAILPNLRNRGSGFRSFPAGAYRKAVLSLFGRHDSCLLY